MSVLKKLAAGVLAVLKFKRAPALQGLKRAKRTRAARYIVRSSKPARVAVPHEA